MNFEAYAKVPRLNREVVITEKIDGTNGQILIHDKNSYFRHYLEMRPGENFTIEDYEKTWLFERTREGAILTSDFIIRVGSRNRWLTEKQDNFGFWRWVYENREELTKLGVGRHYGEWWGQGIQRGYGLTRKVFSLFDTHIFTKRKFEGQHPFTTVPNLDVVPILHKGSLCDSLMESFYPAVWLELLRRQGSKAAPGFNDPEGIMVYHTAGKCMFKATCKDDEKPKGSIEE